jgi:hypothetical protein
MNEGFNVEPGSIYYGDAYRDVYQEVQHRLRTTSPTRKTLAELERYARSKAREITDSSETLQDDMRICHQAIIDSARAYLRQGRQLGSASPD